MNWEIFTDRWLQRAERGQVFVDDGDRFMSLWIAFNGWMRGRFGEAIGDRNQIESVKEMQDFKDVFNNLKTKDVKFRECLEKLEILPIVNMQFRNNQVYVRKAEKLKQYKGYINDLSPNEAGKFKIQDDKEGFAVRANLKRAAKALGLNATVQKRENYIYFWKEEDH
ncbi:hypothetical protein ACFLWZ_01390 [Chloroflexota bacterium]